ncbi:MAG: hypothetical protein KDB03_00830 [Planctomycetales bacterium]|nr:hypothetical protein [Planctomycetales bacterium]
MHSDFLAQLSINGQQLAVNSPKEGILTLVGQQFSLPSLFEYTFEWKS